MNKTIKAPPTCELCSKEVKVKKGKPVPKRCTSCADRYDSEGRLFLIYKECRVYQRGTTQLYLWFYESKCVGAPQRYRKLLDESPAYVAGYLLKEGYQLIDVQEPILK